jgi:oligoribonuclease NrnB/cAMP/cGMP phosphodiesterase (DHH superfamily)
MKSDVICFYHSRDLDGKCSAAIVRKRYPDCQLYGIDYGDTFPLDIVTGESVVFMVDFSLPMEDMLKLYSNTRNLIWIDHHISAINDYNDTMKNLPTLPGFAGKRDIKKAACELTWEHLFPTQDVPRAVELLSMYDIWDHSDPDTLPFQMGARMKSLGPDNHVWKDLLVSPSHYDESEGKICIRYIDTILKDGATILNYQDKQNTDNCRSNAFEVEFEGLKCIVLNAGFGSRLFKSAWSDQYDMMITFTTNGKQWRVSLYQDDRPNIDCSVIAKKYGGGGHKGAAGFQCTELPFNVINYEYK